MVRPLGARATVSQDPSVGAGCDSELAARDLALPSLRSAAAFTSSNSLIRRAIIPVIVGLARTAQRPGPRTSHQHQT